MKTIDRRVLVRDLLFAAAGASLATLALETGDAEAMPLAEGVVANSDPSIWKAQAVVVAPRRRRRRRWTCWWRRGRRICGWRWV